MNDHEPAVPSAVPRASQRSFVHALAWVVLGWSLVTTILWVTIDRRDTSMLSDALLIAVASGAIACVALLPGMLIEIVVPAAAVRPGSREWWGRLIVALATGMVIRSVGTVALFLTYGYQLPSSTEMIAGMTLGWYVFLTSIEVLVVARSLPQSAAPHAEVSIHVDSSMPVKV